MKSYKNLQIKITLLVFVVILCVGVFFGIIFISNADKRSSRLTQSYMHTINSLIEMSVTHHLASGDSKELMKVVSILEKDKNIDSIHLIDFAGDELCVTKDSPHVASGNDHDRHFYAEHFDGKEKTVRLEKDGKQILSYYKPFSIDETCRSCHSVTAFGGFLNVNVDLTEYSQRISNNVKSFTFVLVFIVLTISAVLVVLLRKIITEPVNELLSKMNEVTEHNLDAKLDLKTNDEFETISNLFNKMVESQKKAFETVNYMHKSTFYKDRMATVGTLTSSISHEIKNPLNSIMLNADLVKMKFEGSTVYGDRIIANADRIKEIIDKTLGFSRYRSEEGECIDIVEYMQNMDFYLRRTIFTSNSPKFSVEIDENVTCVFMERIKFDQLIMNILSNAVEAVDAENDNSEVKVTISEDDKYSIISIWDNGCGIPDENKPKIFDEFFTTKEGSAGIGLNISKEIVEQYDGHIDFESEKDEWSVFKIYIPLAPEKCTNLMQGACCRSGSKPIKTGG